MRTAEIFDAAKRLISASACDTREDDYEERAPYVAAAICSEAGALDRAYRRSEGLPPQRASRGAFIPLERDFPLCDRFASAAACYMGAMLVLDEDSDLYEKLFDRWCDSLAAISAEIEFKCGSTVDVYGNFDA